MSRLRKARRPLVAGLAGARWSTGRLNRKRCREVRLTAALATFGLVVSGTMGSAAAQPAPAVVYDAIGPTLPGNVISRAFEATGTNEFGDLVALAPGPRELTTVSVAMSSWACESGTGTPGCATTAGATFDHPLTMTLYNVAGTPTAPTVGSVITTLTETFAIPYRPSADLVNCSGGQWFDGTTCFNGFAVVVDFVFPTGTSLPETLIWGISYNTATSGYSPIGEPGPYDSLNVGSETFNPTIGTDVDEDTAFISSGTGSFVIGPVSPDERPMARIEARVPPTVPGPPTDIIATPGDGQVTLSWTAPPDGGAPITGYVIGGGGTCTPTPAAATSCVVTGLTNGVAVNFTVAAVNSVGTGPAATSPTVSPFAPVATGPWVPLGGIVVDSPAAATQGPGRLDVVVRGWDDQLWHKWFDGGGWSAWEPLGGLTTAGPATTSWSAGRLDVFVNGVDGQLWHKWYDGAWSDWVPLGGIVVDSPAAATQGPGRLDVVVRGWDDQLWHKWFDGGGWSAWEPLGGLTTAGPATTSWSAGRLDVFVNGVDGQLWHKWYDGAWSDWVPLGGIVVDSPAAATQGPGRLDVVVRGWDDQLWHKWLNGGSWSAWEPLGGLTTAGPATTSWSAGRLDVFVNGVDGQLWHKS